MSVGGETLHRIEDTRTDQAVAATVTAEVVEKEAEKEAEKETWA